jgi:catechol 2,3-dioxygenase-like lactoylglutathione lyase family enzyme
MLGEHPITPVLLAKDLAAAREFYHDKLGLEILTENENAIVFKCGGGTHLDVTRSTVGTADSQTQASWQVTDIRAEVAELRARGCQGRGLRHARAQDRGRHRRHRLCLGGLDHRPG